MINALLGDIIQVQDGQLLLRCGFIEFDIAVSNQTASRLSNLKGEQKQNVRILTVLVHREDSMSLYGFFDADERQAFLQLQTVSGIGAKQAMKILGGISVRHLVEALDGGNLQLLGSIPGIGPKTAQKMILALRNVLVLEEDISKAKDAKSTKTSPWSDIIQALVDMGYERRLVEQQIEKIIEKEASQLEKLSHHDSEELLFRSAIKALG
ncbi:MAG: Holliday junction branch migration protein RuvA [Spirochaetia bacterium]|nr:Holliday junction branch migration protein RuvA [Spirochaetia bacterium]